jgi:hypothetical protein
MTKPTEDEGAPRRISNRVLDVDITGYATPWLDGQPLLLRMPGTSDLFVAVFSTPEKLKVLCNEYGLAYDNIKQITNQAEFLVDVLPHARIAVDPYKHENGRMRFTEIQPPPFTGDQA